MLIFFFFINRFICSPIVISLMYAVLYSCCSVVYPFRASTYHNPVNKHLKSSCFSKTLTFSGTDSFEWIHSIPKKALYHNNTCSRHPPVYSGLYRKKRTTTTEPMCGSSSSLCQLLIGSSSSSSGRGWWWGSHLDWWFRYGFGFLQ